MAKKNWDVIRNQKIGDNVKYRDVYEDQQLEHGSLQKKQNMTSRTVICVLLAALAFVLVWTILTVVDMFNAKPTLEVSSDPQKSYFYVAESYVDVTDTDKHITPEEYKSLCDGYDPNWPVAEKPEPVYKSSDFTKKTANVWEYKFDKSVVLNNAQIAELKEHDDEYPALKAQYDADLAAYEAYVAHTENPEEKYKLMKAHYRSIYDHTEYLLPDAYEQAVADYNAAKEKMTEDELSVPARPIDPATLYSVAEYMEVEAVDVNDSKGKSSSERVPMSYVNKYDGRVIDAYAYDEMVATYESDYEAYKTAYAEHRKKYHPDNIKGDPTMDFGFTMTKFVSSLVMAGLVFGMMFAVLSKNLKAANLMSDTSDINQYHNDQHVALPEEVQRNYDWFPDVGAHSSVQVSSMISHMALTNKGLKTVQLAKRATADIVNQNGDVEYHKGDILRDENGEPITQTVPMIDEQFMEDLFDASGSPKDKDIRKRYDATKIPYNPDGSNRDKLGKYETVADLINADWDFPVYEPQRPAGAYIVDTAPVNTMVLAITRAG